MGATSWLKLPRLAASLSDPTLTSLAGSDQHEQTDSTPIAVLHHFPRLGQRKKDRASHTDMLRLHPQEFRLLQQSLPLWKLSSTEFSLSLATSSNSSVCTAPGLTMFIRIDLRFTDRPRIIPLVPAAYAACTVQFGVGFILLLPPVKVMLELADRCMRPSCEAMIFTIMRGATKRTTPAFWIFSGVNSGRALILSASPTVQTIWSTGPPMWSNSSTRFFSSVVTSARVQA